MMGTLPLTTIASLLTAAFVGFITHFIWGLLVRPRPKEFELPSDVIVDVWGFPGDELSPDIDQFYAKISDALKTADTKWCLAGLQAWGYFDTRSVINEQEIVVPHLEVENVARVFTSMPEFCVPFRHRHFVTNLRQFPRFKVEGANLYFVIIPDTYYSFSPLSEEKFITPQPGPFPVLHLKYYVEGLGARPEWSYRVEMECLVDVMDLDEAWCTRNLDPAGPAWRTMLKLVRKKDG